MASPLKWCLDWNNLTPKEKFLMGAPFVATEDKARKDIIAQLNLRSEADLRAWDAHPQEFADVANLISNALKQETIWPSHIFLPEDPVDIVFGFHFDLAYDDRSMKPVAQAIVEKQLGIAMDPKFWFQLEAMKFSEAVARIAQRQTEQSHRADGGNASS